MEPLRVGVVGTGYWGPNLVRNFQACPDTDLLWVCDLDRQRAARTVGRSGVRVSDTMEDLLKDPEVEAVAIVTPVATHADVALRCLDAGKHVLLEKPLALSVAEGAKLVDRAAELDLVLMCDHTYCYTPAVRRIRDLLHSGDLGEIQYLDSVRINFGLVREDIDVFWDLAPHDLSILDFILPEEDFPVAVAAQGADPIGAGHSCVGYLSLPLSSGGIAHLHVNWLSPTKVRTMLVGGSKRMVLWDDLNPSQRLSMFDKGVDLNGDPDREARREALVSYRIGDMVAPALREHEALLGVVEELASAVRQGRRPLTDGKAGLRVLRILEAASRSMKCRGTAVPLDPESA